MSKLGLTSLSTFLYLSVLMGNGCSSVSTSSNVGQPNEASSTPYSTSTFGLADVSTFDVYVDDWTVHLLLGGKESASDKQIKLSYIQSENGGDRWDTPNVLNTLPPSINSRGNDIQLAAKNNKLIAVWQSKGELPGMGPMVSAYSLDKGKTWKIGANPAQNPAGDQSHIDLIADQHEKFHAVWLEDPEENGYQSLRYSSTVDNGKQWRHASTLDDSTCSCCWNTFALSPNNEINILFRDMKPRDMALLQSKDEGNTWKKISRVGQFGWQFDGCPHVGGGLAYSQTTNRARLHSLIWTGVEQKAGLHYLVSENNGISWSPPQRMGNNAIHGDIAAIDGTLVAIWDEMEAEGSGIFYAKSKDNGLTWQQVTRLTLAKAAATHPRLVSTKYGFLALWTEKPNKQPNRLAWQLLE